MTTKRKHARTKRPDQALRDCWRYYYYEHEMLSVSGEWLVKNLLEDAMGYEFPIHMEAFLVHARNLYQFYYAQTLHDEEPAKHPPPRDDDLIAEDYCEGVMDWKPPPENRLPDELISRIDKRLAHLTHKRTIGQRTDYDYKDILGKLESTRDVFYQAVPSDRIDSVFNFWYLPPTFWEEPDEI